MIEKKRHIMIDIETLGRKPGAVILSVAAVEFDIGTGNVISEYYDKFNVSESIKDGFMIDGNTLRFWIKQDPEIFREALTPGDKSNIEILQELTSFIKGDSAAYVWANSPSFDLTLLENYYDFYNLKTPWSFTNEMDVRTISNLKPEVRQKLKKESTMLHHPLEDCNIQIKTIKTILYD